MRALVLKRFGELVVEEAPDPHPQDDEVVIRVAATGICGSDIHGYTGENGRRQPGQVMGHESSGTIMGLGPAVDPAVLPVGAAVTFNPVVIPPTGAASFAGREQHHPGKYVIGVDPAVRAAFADQVVIPARNVVLLPDSLPLELGALVEPMAVAIHAVRRAGVRPGEVVAVVGGGPIGQCVVLALQQAGAASIVVAELSQARRDLVSTLGATAVDTRERPLWEVLEQSTGGLSNVAIDAVGSTGSLGDALAATELGGRVCLVGMAAPTVELDAFAVSTQERALVGSFTFSAADFADSVTALASTPVDRVRSLVSLEVGPSEADEQFRRLGASADAVAGKVLVRFDR
ncbi:MAG: alcohol dehydrogenase catalytic domain-containing protein [Microbacteriaceae bacterium]|nr:alcohol dehydrogenase catalytic domain-containing protein [Microbacteriaceae bacterium]